MKGNELELRRRFVNDTSMPVQVLESPYFEYYLKLYEEYGDWMKQWQALQFLVGYHFDGNINKFIEEYGRCRDTIIKNIEASSIYKDFCLEYSFTDKQDTEFSQLKRTSVWNQENDHGHFLSIDLKAACFQVFRYINPRLVYNDKEYDGINPQGPTYREFLRSHLGPNHVLEDYFERSKYTRSVIFGKLNMKRNVLVQRHIMENVYNILKSVMEEFDFIPESYCTDELIYYYNKDEEYYPFAPNRDEFYWKVIQILQGQIPSFEFNLSDFSITSRQFKTGSGTKLTVYEKYNYNSEGVKFMCVPSTYFAQVYRALRGVHVEKKIVDGMDADRVFNYEKQLAYLIEPLEQIK